jgi:hypothetical protein
MKRSLVLIIMMLYGGIIGCTGATGTVKAASKLAVEIAPTSGATVSRADIRVSDGQLLLYGAVRRYHRVHLPGHVDVNVIAPDGAVVEQKQIKVPGLNSARKGRMDVPFLARLDSVPPEGSVIRFWYHAPGGENSACENLGLRS